MAKETQTSRIIKYMQDFGSISSLQAISDLGCMRLASRINDLKRMGYSISSSIVYGTNRYGEPTHYSVYRLEGE